MFKRIICMSVILALILTAVCSGLAEGNQFTGSSQGFGGEVNVTLTIEDGGILNAEVVGDAETEGVGKAAIPTLAEQIVDAQSDEIDGVAGATFTSNAVREAAALAIAASRGEGETETKLVPGTYTATQRGFQQGHVTVNVTVEEDKIVAVEIAELTDNPKTVAGVPANRLPDEIVANQTFNVDSISGATFTSNAIKMAVKDCLEQAGGSAPFSTPVEHSEIVEGEDVTTDVLVIGGGGSGIMAALGAYFGDSTDDRSGLQVTIVEKNDILGGSTGLSGGMFYSYEDKAGAYDESWFESIYEQELAIRQKYNTRPVNEELLRNEMMKMKTTQGILEDLGVLDEFGPYGLYENFKYFPPFPGETDEERWWGNNFTFFMNGYLPYTDIDVRMHTAALSLLTDENGAVIGAAVQDKTTAYNIYAKKVVLATGSITQNPEMIAAYAPDNVGTLTFASGGNKGDGIRMGVEIGAQTIGDSMLGYLGVDSYIGIMPDFAITYCTGSGIAMDVNKDGVRFCDESQSVNVRYTDIAKQKDSTAFAIADSDNPDATALIDSTSEYVCHAETIEELAELLGIPSDKLVETVEQYNTAFDNGGDDVFGTPVESMDRIDAAPFYAAQLRPVAIGGLVSLAVDGNCHVLNEQGEAIENLYAVGEMSLGNELSYYVGGHGVGYAMYSGTLAGETIKNDLIG